MPIETVMVVVYNKNLDEVLLVKHGEKAEHLTGYYGLPGGRIQEGETLEEAARRELFEETGLIARNLYRLPEKFYARIKRKDGTVKEFVGYAFLVTNWEGKPRGTDETEPVWVNIRDLENLLLLPNVKKIVELARSYVEKMSP